MTIINSHFIFYSSCQKFNNTKLTTLNLQISNGECVVRVQLLLKVFPLIFSATLSLYTSITFAGNELAKGQASLEVVAELAAGVGVGNITFTPDNQIIFSNHPLFYPAVKVAKLNADKKSLSPFPNASWQTCQNSWITEKFQHLF